MTKRNPNRLRTNAELVDDLRLSVASLNDQIRALGGDQPNTNGVQTALDQLYERYTELARRVDALEAQPRHMHVEHPVTAAGEPYRGFPPQKTTTAASVGGWVVSERSAGDPE